MATNDASKLKPAAGGSPLNFLRPDTYEELRRRLQSPELVPDPTQFESFERGGKRQFRYRPGAAPDSPGGGGGGGSTGPFHLTVALVGAVWKFTVSSSRSSITDGTNGPDVSISGLDDPTAISATKYIVITADIDEDLVATGWAVSAVSGSDIAEVKFDSSDPPKQEELRIVVGKITFVTVDTETTAVASQALFSCVQVDHGILNGKQVRIANMFSAHPDIL